MIGRRHREDAWNVLDGLPSDDLLAQLIARYSEPGHAYHALQHLRECFDQLAPVSSRTTRLPEVQLALWFHDAIYDTRAQVNEDRTPTERESRYARPE